jgi:imidazolonepropionase-like amidohydrolase
LNAVAAAVLTLTAHTAAFGVTAPQHTLILRDATILDPAQGRAFHGHVRVRGEFVDTVVEGALPSDWTATTVLDLRGRFVMPGLVDLHTHTWGDPSATDTDPDHLLGPAAAARQMLHAGVTAFLDLGSRASEIFAVRDRQRRGQIEGADIHAAGPVFVPGADPATETGDFARVCSDPESARRHVRALATQQPDAVKFILDGSGTRPRLRFDTLLAGITEAKRLKMRSVVHIYTWADMRQAVRAGATAVTHLDDNGPIPRDIVRQMVQQGTVVIPTLGVQGELANLLEHPALLDDPLLARLVPKPVRDTYRKPKNFCRKAAFWATWQPKVRQRNAADLMTLWQAGVRVPVGPDAGNFGLFNGWSVHRELEAYVAAGLPAWDVLRLATVEAGRFLGRRYGIQTGDVGNLIVLDKSPLEAMANTRTVHRVVWRGRVVEQ